MHDFYQFCASRKFTNRCREQTKRRSIRGYRRGFPPIPLFSRCHEQGGKLYTGQNTPKFSCLRRERHELGENLWRGGDLFDIPWLFSWGSGNRRCSVLNELCLEYLTVLRWKGFIRQIPFTDRLCVYRIDFAKFQCTVQCTEKFSSPSQQENEQWS